jgi:hypothetical protein
MPEFSRFPYMMERKCRSNLWDIVPADADGSSAHFLPAKPPGPLPHHNLPNPSGYQSIMERKRPGSLWDIMPDVSSYQSIMKRKRPDSLWDIKHTDTDASSTHVLSTNPPGSLPHATHNLTPRPTSHPVTVAPNGLGPLPFFHPRSSALTVAPIGPWTLICFDWYHTKHCTAPKDNVYGREVVQCMHAHTMDVPQPKVSQPPSILEFVHDPHCSKPLCPIRLSQDGNGLFSKAAPTTLSTDIVIPMQSARYDLPLSHMESGGTRRQPAYGNDLIERETPAISIAEYFKQLPRVAYVHPLNSFRRAHVRRTWMRQPEGLLDNVEKDIYVKEEPVTPPRQLSRETAAIQRRTAMRILQMEGWSMPDILSMIESTVGQRVTLEELKRRDVTPEQLLDLDDDDVLASVPYPTATSDEQPQEASDELLEQLEQTSVHEQGPTKETQEMTSPVVGPLHLSPTYPDHYSPTYSDHYSPTYSNHYSPAYPDHYSPPACRDEQREEEDTDTDTEGLYSESDGGKNCAPTYPDHYSPSAGRDEQREDTDSDMNVEYSYSENDGGKKRGTVWYANLPDRTKGQSRILVDYKLPEGLARMDWDTDLVRLTFGEYSW